MNNFTRRSLMSGVAAIAVYAASPANALTGSRKIFLTSKPTNSSAISINFIADTASVNGVPQPSSTSLLSGSTLRRSGSGLYVQSIARPLQLMGCDDVNQWSGTKTAGQSAFDGKLNAVLMTPGTGVGVYNLQGNFGTPPPVGSYEQTFEVKASGSTPCCYVQFNSNVGTGGAAALNFTLNGAGTVGTPYNLAGTTVITGGDILALGNGWYRITILATVSTVGATNSFIGPADNLLSRNFTGNSSNGLFIHGPTVREDTAAFLVPSTSNGVLTFTFDDNSTQNVNVVPGQYFNMVGLNRPLVKSVTSAAGTASLNGFPRAVATGGRWPTALPAQGSVTSANTRWMTRNRDWIGAGGADYLQFSFVGYTLGQNATNGGGQGPEESFTSTQPIEMEIAFPTLSQANPIRVTFSGATKGSIAPGVTEYLSDPVYPAAVGLTKFPANTKYWQTIIRDFNVGDVPAFTVSTSGTASVYSDETGNSVFDLCYVGPVTGLNQIALQGPFAVAGGYSTGATVAQLFLPTVIHGRTSTPVPAVLGTGDSIARGQNDQNGDGQTAGGWFARGLFNVDGSGKKLPWSICAKDASQPIAFLNGTKKQSLFKYFTHATCDHGHNFDQTPASAEFNNVLVNIWANFKGAIGTNITHFEQSLMIVDTTSSDNWATAANQTISTFGTFRASYNPLITGAVGSNPNIDNYIDLNPAVEDGSNLGKWKSNGTANTYTPDGTHPSAFATAAMATIFAARANTW